MLMGEGDDGMSDEYNVRRDSPERSSNQVFGVRQLSWCEG
jgi:hypothetical protein